MFSMTGFSIVFLNALLLVLLLRASAASSFSTYGLYPGLRLIRYNKCREFYCKQMGI